MKRWGAVAAAVALVAAALWLMTLRPAAAPPPVDKKPVAAPARPMVQIVAGQIEARHTVTVELSKPGTIDEFLADVGQNVVEGQVLARLATATAADAKASALMATEAKATAAKSAVGEAKLEAVKAKADAQHAKAQLAQARHVFEREQKLMEVGATPRNTLERAQREFEAAQAESVTMEEAWRQADNRAYAMADQLREATAASEAANKEDAQARASLAAAEIHAPATGMVVWRKGAEEGKEIFRIALEMDQLRAVFAAEKVKQGEDVLITVAGVNIAPIRAVVSTLVSTIDGARAIADFASPSPAILPGALCTVSVQLK
jgi:HlyD family secretion protein